MWCIKLLKLNLTNQISYENLNSSSRTLVNLFEKMYSIKVLFSTDIVRRYIWISIKNLLSNFLCTNYTLHALFEWNTCLRIRQNCKYDTGFIKMSKACRFFIILLTIKTSSTNKNVRMLSQNTTIFKKLTDI